MRNTPSLNGLKCFEASARLLSFKDAADELFVTPAAISNQISKLEESLGVKLFKRLNRRVELTESGVKYLVRMRIIFDDIEEATRDIVQKGETSFISLVVPPMFLKSWFISIIPSLSQLIPSVNLKIIDTLKILDFEKEDINAAIRYGFGGWNDSGEEVLLFKEDICPICSPELLANSPTLNSPADLHHFSLIYTERRLVQWDNYLSLSEYEVPTNSPKIWFLNSIHTLEAALQGLGVALINKKFIRKYLDSGQLVIPFELPPPTHRKPGYYFVSTEKELLKDEIQLLKSHVIKLASTFELDYNMYLSASGSSKEKAEE